MPDSELTVDVDWDRIVRVLTNLVSNATKTVAAQWSYSHGGKRHRAINLRTLAFVLQLMLEKLFLHKPLTVLIVKVQTDIE